MSTSQGLQVDFKELGVREGLSSPEEACDLHSPMAKRIIAVDWSDRLLAEWQIIGTAYTNEDGSLHRHLPERHPEKPWLWATRITRMRGLAWRDTITNNPTYQVPGNVFEKAIFEVEYTVPNYFLLLDRDLTDPDIGNVSVSEVERYIEYLPDPTADYLSVPFKANSFQFTTANGGTKNKFAGNVGVIVPGEMVRIKWWQVPEDFLTYKRYDTSTKSIEDRITASIGSVNEDGFFDGRFTYAEEHLLLTGAPRRERIFMPHDGSPGWNLTFEFKWSPFGHNHFYDFQGSDPDWRLATLGGDAMGKTLYKYRDYGDIFP